ncbi:serine hydrolase domain-containing protein [Myceligenerans pegani]|uniref:Beta-lactamase family protein n=1 Tax=Myceligenerans pegani TaxID=2776917 RepID=A0ABR9N4Y7_9MICO|nr:serine hydrolase domain-containing protein [Myceligenerans sp. TRM 65318]MBE1878713.1 beta-lactamase family protein [Myceligenerans sp. TRM 65318]MBE3020984.1 beta-lactamase family protein [Myceligenerans sp. TRM 65318]
MRIPAAECRRVAVAVVTSGIVATQLAAPAAAQRDTGIEQVVAEVMEDHGLPGAAVAVVADGKVETHGLGVSDATSGDAVDPEQTRFPIDSVTKVFTATAVMTLVDEGLLDLDTDVNDYLREVEVPDTYPGRPITLRHLLTHTAGFEERVIGNLAASDGGLTAVLRDRLPARLRPPGELAAYSNDGFALAGLVAADALGVDFAEVLSTRLLAPLGMDSTSLLARDPVPFLATLHGQDGRALPREGEPLSPAGGLVSTAADMGLFMRFQLGEGDPVLTPDAKSEMHHTQFRHDPRLPGSALGLREDYRGKTRMLVHGGDGPGSHSLMTLVPGHDRGVFVVFNGDGTRDGAASAELATDRILDLLLGKSTSADGPSGTETPDTAAAAESGSYGTTRMNYSDYSGLFLALGTGVDVAVKPDGSLTTIGLTTDPGAAEQDWRPVGEGLYQERGGSRLIAFGESDGRLMLYDGHEAHTKLAWHEQVWLHLVLAMAGFMLLASLIVWPLGAAVRRRRARRPLRRSHGERIAEILAGATGLLVTAFVVAMSLLLADPERFMVRVLEGRQDIELAAIPLALAVVTSLGMVCAAVLGWIRDWWGRGRRVHYTLAALGATLVVGFAMRYHLATAPLALL